MNKAVIEIPGHGNVECIFKYSSRARYIRIKITSSANVEIVLPPCAKERDGLDFAHKNIAWITKNLSVLSRRIKCAPPERRPESLNLRFLTRSFKISWEFAPHSWYGAKLDFENNILHIKGNVLDTAGSLFAVGELLKREAAKYIAPFLGEVAEECGIDFAAVSFRIQKRRWGSCSTGRNISINALLLFMREDVVRYVLVHELCHLLEMNHSEAFWKHVARFCPDYSKLKRELAIESASIPSSLLKL